MTAEICEPVDPQVLGAGRNVAHHVQRLTGDLPGSPTAVVIHGPGGTGKTFLLGELASSYRRAGATVVDGHSAPEPDHLIGDCVVLVDDGHRLSPETADRVRRFLGRSRTRVVVACRPWPRPAPLVALLEAMGSDRRDLTLRHADRGSVLRWTREQVGDAASPGLVDVVLHETGGLPGLVHSFLRSLSVHDGSTMRGIPRPSGGPLPMAAPGQAPRIVVPGAVMERIETGFAELADDTRRLLHVVAAGSPLDTEVLSGALDVSRERVADLLSEARASGFLLGSGEVVPLVGRALLAATPADLTRAIRRRLLGLLLDRGDEPVALARTLAADGVRDAGAARLLEQHANAALGTDPTLAGELLGDAAASGARVTELAARRAQAAALAGDLDAALRWADAVLTDPEAPDRARAAGVAAAVLAQRGLLARSADLYRLAGPERAGAAALALIGTGNAAEAATVLEKGRTAAARCAPSIVSSSEELTAQGVLQSLRSGSDAGDYIAAALSTLTRAAQLMNPVGRAAVVLDTPAALAALVALHCGELGVAESGLERALAADVGGCPSRPRHLLLLAWAAMLRGRMSRAREYMARAEAAASGHFEPRDDLFLQALHVGLARRTSNLPALTAAWARAREAILRHPIDLFALLPLGELMVAGAKLKDGERVGPQLAEAQALLHRLGQPTLWASSLHWSGAQAAILGDDPVALQPHATALVESSRTSRYAATLADAGRCWLRVLTGDVDPTAVESAAQALAAVGLAWDGSRLAGQAAARALDPRARASLLICARALSEADCGEVSRGAPARATDRGEAAPAPSGHLSEREREVARLVVAGQTYREIGAQLFISAKTVEHHVSRIRQRLGASSRSDLLAWLRAELTEGA
jgi:DNA-binding CsgD family transcriptional regulator